MEHRMSLSGCTPSSHTAGLPASSKRGHQPTGSISHTSIVSKASFLRKSSSIRELRDRVFQLPEKLFRRPNQSEIALPQQKQRHESGLPDPPHVKEELTATEMKRSRPMVINPTTKDKSTSHSIASHSMPSTTVNPAGWALDFAPVSFSPTLSVEITPLSPPGSPPPSRSNTFYSFRRKLSLRSPTSAPSRPPTSNASSHKGFAHERRQSKYLNDPTVVSMLSTRNFEEALELGFTSPPPTPQNRSPSPIVVDKFTPITPISVDGTTIVEPILEEEEDEDYFAKPMPDLALRPLKELEEGPECKDVTEGNLMTLRLTLTPAACLTEMDGEFMPPESSPMSKRMSGIGRLLSRTRSRKVKI